MPHRKVEQVVRTLRSEILSGDPAPGEQLPTYDALIERFQVTRPTVARVLKALRNEGLIRAKGKRGTFVAATFPHHSRYLWVTSERPDSLEWTSFLTTLLDLIEQRETGVPGEIIPLLGVDGRANNLEYQTLCDAVEHGSVAGLLLMTSATIHLLPVLQSPGLPRVAIWAPLPHAALVTLDFEGLIERACDRLIEKGKRVAIISPHTTNLERSEECLLRRGFRNNKIWALHVAPVGCEHITELLFDRPDRPDAIFVTDDNLVRPVLAGLERAKVRPGRDVFVLAHCNWPRPIGAGEGVEHIGFDAREVLALAKECIDAERDGEKSPRRLVPPRFAGELR